MKKFILTNLILLFLVSCKSSNQMIMECPDEIAQHNLGKSINSPKNEVIIKLLENKLFLNILDSNRTDIYEIKNKNLVISDLDNHLKSHFNNFEIPVKIRDKLFTSSPTNNNANNNLPIRNIFSIDRNNNISPIDILNTGTFEGQLQFDEKQSRLYFVSGRNGNLDIFYSNISETGISLPQELKNINTDKDEAFPFIINEDIYFSRRDDNHKYSIFKGKISQDAVFDIKALSNDINSNFNDISPVIIGDSIYYTSDRIGGCGLFDVYSQRICSEVKLEGSVVNNRLNIPKSGYIELFESNGLFVKSYEVTKNGLFNFKLTPNKEYYLVYSNNCFNNSIKSESFYAPCSLEKISILYQEIHVPDYVVEFTFEEYNIPFFVTGYYKPNTLKSYHELKRLFEAGIIKKEEGFGYIEYPSKKYEDYAMVIDSAFYNCLVFIKDKLKTLEDECQDGNEKLRISVTGYSDPRPLSSNSIYFGNDIYSFNNLPIIKNRDPINNDLLSVVRAYNTLNYLLDEIDNSYYDKIILEFSGQGADNESDLPNDIKRRVKISISIIETD